MLIRFGLVDVFLWRPQQEISVCGWLTKVWVEQQPWMTELFDPAPVELLHSMLKAAVPLIHFNNPLFTPDLNQDWLETQHPVLSNLWSLQIHKLLVDCVRHQTHKAKKLYFSYCIPEIHSVSLTFLLKMKCLRDEEFCLFGFYWKIKEVIFSSVR